MIETYLLMNLMEGLVTLDSDRNVVPALAQSFSVSEDGKTYTFKIRSGVKWSDGKPLQAQDFVTSWRRLLSPVTAASYAYLLYDIVNAQKYNQGKISDFTQVGVKAKDAHTLEVRLKQPVAHWKYIPTFWVTFPLRDDVLKKYGTAWSKPGAMVTTGPFVLSSYDVGSKIVLLENKNYWGKKGNIKKVEAYIVLDNSTALSLYEMKKIDFLTDIATLDLKRLAANPELKTFPYLKVGYLGFNTQKFPVNFPEVRRAIGMAIQKASIGSILFGGQRPAGSFVPPGLLGHDPEMGLNYDPNSAKEELKKAGLQNIKIELVIPNWEKQLTLAQFIQAELKKNLGIQLVIQPFDHKTYRTQLNLKTYPMHIASWGADFPDPDNFLSIFLEKSGNNRLSWKNKDYDQLVESARIISQDSLREKKYKEAQTLLLKKDVAIVPLYYEPNLALVRSRVKGLELNPMNYLYLRKVSLE